ncbi:MAG: ABC transporter substrate-binding protein [Phascolarctobacterium sp.]
MSRLLSMMCMLLVVFSLAGCATEKPASGQPQQTLLLYSELDGMFTEDLVRAFNKEYNNKICLKATYELPQSGQMPDLVLAEKRTLNGLKIDGMLKPTEFVGSERLAEKFHDQDLCWYGAFYDPTVFLVNQQFARIVGQNNLKGWSDLESHIGTRIVMENLSDTNSTQNFLSAFADQKGETGSLNYLWNINRFVVQYAKFPFTPIRMAAVGDADVAITRQSYVFKYLENKFPAYVVIPEEGTPVNLYGVGLFKATEQEAKALQFMEWLLRSEEVKKIASVDNTGYLFLLSDNGDGAVPDKLWLNHNYLTVAKQDSLTDKWLQQVRFSK